MTKPLILTRAKLRRDPGAAGAIADLILGAMLKDRVGGSHKLVWSLFGYTGTESRDFLFREMEEPGSYLILSEREPMDSHNLWNLESREFTTAFEDGAKLRFMLRANPTITVGGRKEDGTRGKRHDVVMHLKHQLRGTEMAEDYDQNDLVAEAGINWIRKKTMGVEGKDDLLGFTVFEDTCLTEGYRRRLVARKEKADIVLPSIDFSGVLQVTNPEIFSNTLRTGIGRGRAFGLGMLMVR